MNWFRILGVVFLAFLYLRSPIDLLPDRIGLLGFLDDLIVIVLVVRWVQRQLRQPGRSWQPPASEPHAEGAWNPYAVLGVSRSASPDEITSAYRAQLKRYHPDRVADLGDELQRLAHDKTIEIQRAYADIGRK